jgi:hypothetical protein
MFAIRRLLAIGEDYMRFHTGPSGNINHRQLLSGRAFAAGLPSLVTAPIIDTEFGKVEGTMIQGVGAYLAIHYGAPPVAAQRFKAPQKPAAWRGFATVRAT